MMLTEIKSRAYEILENTRSDDSTGKAVNIFLIVLICLNVVAVVMETVDSVYQPDRTFFTYFDMFSVAVFTVEYALRLWTCDADPQYKGLTGRFRYAFTFFALVDLISILPFYIPMFLPVGLRMARMFRLVRIFRLFKLSRYSDSLRTIENVFRSKKEEILMTLFMGAIIVVISSTLMYYAERDVQPDKFSSIPAAMWWSVTTMSTVGYGDVFPITAIGRVIGAFTALLGVGMFALPAGILGSGFVEEIQKKKSHKQRICPHCGKDLDQAPYIVAPQPIVVNIQNRKQ
jgi:voltage-gated potassium channel